MARTMTVDLGNELRSYVEYLVHSGDYKTNSEALRESLRLFREKQADSKLEKLRHLIVDLESIYLYGHSAFGYKKSEEYIRDIEAAFQQVANNPDCARYFHH